MLDDGVLLGSLQQLRLTVPVVRRQQTVSQVKPAAADWSVEGKWEKSFYFDTESSAASLLELDIL